MWAIGGARKVALCLVVKSGQRLPCVAPHLGGLPVCERHVVQVLARQLTYQKRERRRIMDGKQRGHGGANRRGPLFIGVYLGLPVPTRPVQLQIAETGRAMQRVHRRPPVKAV